MSPRDDRPLPFNTGKVLIGINYQRPFRWEPSRDAYDLQTALLDAHRPAPAQSWLVRIWHALVRIVCGRGF